MNQDQQTRWNAAIDEAFQTIGHDSVTLEATKPEIVRLRSLNDHEVIAAIVSVCSGGDSFGDHVVPLRARSRKSTDSIASSIPEC